MCTVTAFLAWIIVKVVVLIVKRTGRGGLVMGRGVEIQYQILVILLPMFYTMYTERMDNYSC